MTEKDTMEEFRSAFANFPEVVNAINGFEGALKKTRRLIIRQYLYKSFIVGLSIFGAGSFGYWIGGLLGAGIALIVWSLVSHFLPPR